MKQLGLAMLFLVRVVYSQVQIPEDKTIKLNGEWDFVLNQFLSVDEVDSTESIKLNVPGVWNDIVWNGSKFSGKGYGTYFKKLKLSQSSDDVSIYMPSIGTAYKAYVNNYLLAQVGVPGKSPETTIAKIKPEIYRIPNRFRGKEVVLIIHVANFSHQNGGLWFTPEIGNANHHHDNKIRSLIINLIVLGSILIIMLYHFFIFTLRPKEKYSLYFALVCLCMLLHISTQADIAIIHLFPAVSWQAIFRITYSSLIMIGALNLSFIQKLYPSLIPKAISKYTFLISTAFAIITWIVPTTISYYFMLFFQALIVIIGLYLMGIITIAARREMSGARILLVGFSFTFIAAVHDILNSLFLIESASIIHYGVFIYILTLSLVLAKKFVRFINSNERLKFELNILNEDLEKRVETRTSELQLQERLVKEKNQKLELANEELNQLMAILAHDLKSPLLNIYSLSQMIRDQMGKSLQKENEMMQKIAIDGVSMIDSLISLNKLENENLEVGFKPFDLTKLIQIKAEEFKPQIENKQQQLKTSIEPNIEIVSSDRHISQVLDNLLSNAIKFSPPNTTIQLELEKKNGAIKICIKDEGPGFSDIDKVKIFGKFQKLSARPTAGETSSGLGLSIVKMLIEKLGGKIHLESEKDQGAAFCISFPH